jgi:hypothetical protein
VNCRFGRGSREHGKDAVRRQEERPSAQGNGLEPVIALVELQDHLVPDHGVIIADHAKLKLNAQSRRHAGLSTNSVW